MNALEQMRRVVNGSAHIGTRDLMARTLAEVDSLVEKQDAALAAETARANELAAQVVELERERDEAAALLAEHGSLREVFDTLHAEAQARATVVERERDVLRAELAGTRDLMTRVLTEVTGKQDAALFAETQRANKLEREAKEAVALLDQRYVTLRDEYDSLRERIEALRIKLADTQARAAVTQLELDNERVRKAVCCEENEREAQRLHEELERVYDVMGLDASDRSVNGVQDYVLLQRSAIRNLEREVLKRERDAPRAGVPTTLECAHCGGVAHKSHTGLFVDGDGTACASCGLPGHVSVENDDVSLRVYWWSDDRATCTRADCDECVEAKGVELQNRALATESPYLEATPCVKCGQLVALREAVTHEWVTLPGDVVASGWAHRDGGCLVLAAELEREKERAEKAEKRLNVDPGGSDKIDELEQALMMVRDEAASSEREAAALREALGGLLREEWMTYEGNLHASGSASVDDLNTARAALAADAGKDFVPRSRAEKAGRSLAAVREVLGRVTNELEAHCGGPRDQSEEEAALLREARMVLAEAYDPKESWVPRELLMRVAVTTHDAVVARTPSCSNCIEEAVRENEKVDLDAIVEEVLNG